MDIVKVSIMGICGMMLGFILKETRPEFAALVTMMTGFLILGLAAGKVSYLFETMNRLRESFPIDSSYLTVLVKIIGITYIGQFSSAICKDAGYKEGDIIEYMEFKDGRNTGRTFKAEIVYIVNEHRGLTEGFCIMGIKVRPEEKEEK